jgi:hypothetical protein
VIVSASNPIGWIVRALRTGEPSLLPGKLPAYARLDAAAKEAATRRGAGRTLPQPLTTGDAAGKELQEPINLMVTGSLDDLKAKLQQAGWVVADERSPWHDLRMGLSAILKLGDYDAAPVSTQYLDGKPQVLAMSKQSDHNRARDHLRIYAVPGGWAIAGTRDVALSLATKGHLDLGHAIDYAVDAERDQIMNDLLQAGGTRWAAVRGVQQGVQVPGGVLLAGKYLTDGLVYEVALTSR